MKSLTRTRRRRSRAHRAALVIMSLLALLLASCGSDSDDGDSPQDEGEAAEGPTGTLRVSTSSELVDLDPHGASGNVGATIVAARQLYDTVVRFDGEQYQPNLATEWSVSEDELTWTFTIRDDVTFHDGTPLTSEDVAASLNRVLELEGSIATLWGEVSAVQAPDPQTVTVTTAEPLPATVANMSLLSVLPADRMSEDGFFDAPVGSGPFKFERFAPGEGLFLTANEDYFGEQAAFERAEMLTIPEESSRVTALLTGELDWVVSLSADQLAELEGQQDIQVENVPSLNQISMFFNHEREPFDNELVRRAMWHAIDINSVVGDLYGDTAQVADAPIPPTVVGYKAQQAYEYDPAQARALLEEAGFPDGFSTTIDYNPGGPSNLELVQSFASFWAEVGIETQVNQKEQATWLSDFQGLKWDLNSFNNGVITGDAEFHLGRFYPSENERLGLNSPEIDALLDQASTETDLEQRAELFGQAEDILWDEAHGIYPVFLNNNYAWRTDTVANVQLDPRTTPLLNLADHP